MTFSKKIGSAAILALSYMTSEGDRPPLDWKPAVWLWPYLGGLTLLSYLGSFDGRDILPFGIDLIAVAIFSLAIFYFAQAVRLSPDRAKTNVDEAFESEVETDEEPETVGADER